MHPDRVSTNGRSAPQSGGDSAADVITALRHRPRNIHLFRGFGPFVAGAILFLAMLWLAPSVAPERIVERPVSTTTVVSTTTTTTTTSTPSTSTTPSTTVAP